MSKVRIVLEAAKSVHPMAVHAYSSGGGKFTVHATGSKVKHVKKGDTVSSSDLDDLTDAGHKVKEVKKPIHEAKGQWAKDMDKARKYAEKKLTDKAKAARDAAAEKKTNESVEEGYQRDSGYGHAADAHYKTLSAKMKDAVNLHLRKGKSYDDAVKAAKVHVKEEEEIEEAKNGTGGYRTKDGTYVPFKSFEKAGQEVRAKRVEAGRALADADKATRARAKANEEVEQVDELKTSTMQSYADKRQASLPNTIERGSKEHKQMQMIGKARDKAAQKLHRGGYMTPSMAREEIEQVDEKLTPEAKSAVKQALGPKTPGNQMRKGSGAARTLISVLKSNKKNVVPGTK